MEPNDFTFLLTNGDEFLQIRINVNWELSLVAVSKMWGILLQELEAVQMRLSISPVRMHSQRRLLVLSIQGAPKPSITSFFTQKFPTCIACNLGYDSATRGTTREWSGEIDDCEP